ncbi:DEAD/DEAH box helicase [Jeotgalibacillus soli]|uniref:ATP-dependent helicase n=1 Tax=Jeotgalibacillus soli TaxID=889306 RepID=A0A0C2W0U0_9BACL|nr:DEAD/DEAH box helicase [Jeotgalibacillus soli]KIL49793.1 ATP-dependent helicase [Jeotgalibacillus soli]
MWISDVKMIDLTQLNDGHFALQVLNGEGDPLDPNGWKHHLLLWHKESYYGTMLHQHAEAPPHSIVLDGWATLTLLSQPSFHGRMRWDMSETAQFYYDAAPLLFEWITEGKWIGEWHREIDMTEEQRFTMTLSEEFWSEWIDMSGPEAASLEEKTKSSVNNWYQQAITYFFQHHHRSQGLAKQIFSQNHALTAADLATYFDEDKWSTWVQEEDLTYPYRFGIRFEEPDSEEGDWTMQPFLRDRRRADWTYDINMALPLERSLPDRWKSEKNEIERELLRWVRLIPYLQDENGEWQTKMTEERAWLFLTEGSQKLLALDVEILLPAWWKSIQQSSVSLKAAVRSDRSYRPSFVGLDALVDYDWKVSINGSDLTEEEFMEMVEQKRRFIQVNGEWISLDPALITRIREAMSAAKKKGIRMRDLLEQELDEAEDESAPEEAESLRIQYELNRSLKSMMDSLHDIGKVPLLSPPAALQGELRPYQQQGFSWMAFLRSNRFGACLADDMGLGKTIQLISYMLHVKETEKLKTPFLIVCPTSVLGNWQREIERFAPSLSLHLHYGPNREKEEAFTSAIKHADIVLTSYGLCHVDQEELGATEWSAVALDEAQNIKNPHTKQSKAIRRLQGQHHIALTGTPMENRLSELWAIFDFINHSYLGSLSSFRQSYVVPIERDGSEVYTRKLQGRIRPFLLRRTKNDPAVGLNLPDKIEQKEFCPLTAEQASLYEQLVKDTLEKIPALAGIERKGLVLQMLNRLKQLCDHPALFLHEDEPDHVISRSEKMLKLMDLVEHIMEAGEATIIFTQYISMGNMIKSVLEKEYGVKVPFLNGSTPKQRRDEMVEQFQRGDFPIFILSLKAGGTGLTLTAANHVVHYDRWWNPAVENQATDRAYRIGQTRFVHVHKFISSGTVEEKIDTMLEKKQSLNEEIIKGDQWITELTNKELEDLLVLT